MTLLETLSRPWPWYLAEPLLGITVPLLLIFGNKHFGLSSNLRHMCAMLPTRVPFFSCNWRREAWNLTFALGIFVGGFVGGVVLRNRKVKPDAGNEQVWPSPVSPTRVRMGHEPPSRARSRAQSESSTGPVKRVAPTDAQSRCCCHDSWR